MSNLQGPNPSYEQKLEKLQRYLPFLRKMITKLERTNDPTRTAQLQKMKHLHAILTDSSRKLKYELLVKCEGVLQKLHDKIEGESDDDVMELPQPARPQPQRPPPPEHQRRMLYPESEWERPSPPREVQRSAPSSSGASRLSDDPPVHSPPLSSFVERISMSSPSASFNEMDQPRSPSPEVVAQIPGAFAGNDHKDKKFERGREILRKLMIGMSKTLDETEVESPPDVDASASRGPKIIPLERESSTDTPDSELRVDDIAVPGCSDHGTDPRGATTMPAESDAYNPEDEWSEIRKKPTFRPSFMSKPPLSKEDLEELNRDLGAGSTSGGTSEEKRREGGSSSSSRSRHRSGESGSRRHGSTDDRRDKGDRRDRPHSSESRLVIRKGETLADAKRRRFEEWKKAEIERRKKRKAELKHSSHGRSRHEPSRSSSSHHRREHSQDRPSSHKADRNVSRHGDTDKVDSKEKVTGKTSQDSTGRNRTESLSMDPKTKTGSVKDPRKQGDSRSDEAAETSKKPDATVEKVSEQLKKYSVQELVKTVHESLSPVARKKELPADDLEQTFTCLVIRNLPPNTLRQDIFRLFHGFGIVELVLEVHFSFTCAGIAYAKLAEHSEAKRARKELADKEVHGNPVKISPCADGIFREAKRTYEQTMNAREEQYAKRQSQQSQPAPQPTALQYPHQVHDPRTYHPKYPSHPHGVSSPLLPRPAPVGVGFNQRPSLPGRSGFVPQQPAPHHHNQSPKFQPHPAAPRHSTPPRPSLSKHNFDNPYNVQPGKEDKTMPSKSDPRRAAQMSYHEQKKQQLEKELEILRRHEEERMKRKEKEKQLQKTKPDGREVKPDRREKTKGDKVKTGLQSREPVKPVSRGSTSAQKPVIEHKAASLGKFKIPKLKKSEPEVTEKPVTSETTSDQAVPDPQAKPPVACHQEDTVSSTVDTEELVVKQKRKRRVVVISDSDSESEVEKTSNAAQEERKNKTSVKQPGEEKGHCDVDRLKQSKSVEKQQPESSSKMHHKLTPDTKTATESESDACETVESDTDRTDTEQTPTTAELAQSFKKKPMVVLTRTITKAPSDADKGSEAHSSKPSVAEVQVDATAVEQKRSETGVTTEIVSDDTSDLQPKEEIQQEDTSTVPIDSDLSNSAADVTAGSTDLDSPAVKTETESIEPEECMYCSFNGKKVIFHYVMSHPGKPIPVKMQKSFLEKAVQEELGPGDDSAKKPLPKDLEAKLLNDDLSWIPPSLMFDYSIACLYCKFTALNKRHMLQHIADHLQSGTSAPEDYSMKCRFCKFKTVNSQELFDHITSHTGEYRYSCQQCGYKVFRMYFLRNHITKLHKDSTVDAISIEEADIGNGWMYGYACKLCGFVQLHERNLKKHMADSHEGSTDYTKINMCLRGPAIDISKKVSEALKRMKADDEKRAASLPPPIDDITVFAVGERWLKELSAEEAVRKDHMNALMAQYSKKLAVPPGPSGSELLQKLQCHEDSPMRYLEDMRQRALEKPPKVDESAEQEGDLEQSQEQGPDDKKGDSDSDGANSEPPWDEDTGESDEAAQSQPLDDALCELQAVRPDDPNEFGYQITMKLAAALRPAAPEPPPTDGLSGVVIKQEPADQLGFSAESDARAAAGLNSMNADLESLMNDFDRFEREQEPQEPPRPKLRIRKLSGDLLSSDDALGGGLGGLTISSVMSLTGGAEADPLQTETPAKKADDLFSFPPEGERRPWKHFLTLKDQSKVMRLMFHMHHKSAYKCNAVHCSLTTNNGTLFKLHLRNHEKCDVCSPDETSYTCMNTRLVCVYCGYMGADLAEHVYKRHAISQFQCGYCFYRTRQNAYMHEHQSDPANPPPGLNSSHLVETEMVGESSLTPYICAQDGCDRAFIKAAVLEQHYAEAHPDASVFPCHVCGLRTDSFAALIGHYIGHGYVAYHCAYCTYANQDQNDVKKHLIDFHPDDPPKCYARIPKTMDVVLGVPPAAAPPPPPQVPPPPLPTLPVTSVKQEPGLGSELPPAPSSPPAADAALAAVKQELESERPASEEQVELEEAADPTGGPPQAPSPPGEPAPLLAEDLYRCGNPRCYERFPTLPSFKDHMLSCPHGENGVLLCFHCPKQVKHVGTALEHIRQHGPKRYSCAMCDFCASMPNAVTKHLKQQHRMSSCTTLPLVADRADPERDQFVVYPRQCVPRAEQPPAASGAEQKSFGVEEIDQLPHRPVLFRAMQCKLCPYSTKVTRNLRKHLLCHRRSDGTAPLPVAAPINPRPCDQRGEKMFDKMANLASSSGEVGVPRKAEELSQADLERLPKEVTEDKRYICSIPGCVYLTLNDTMLKYHIQALHGQMITYPCPHCTDLYMIPDKLSAHLRLHGPRLYKCKYCIYNHYQRSLVTRHVRDKHPMLPLADVVVREPDDDEASRPLFKPWRCGLCKYQALLQLEVVEHVATGHGLSRNQFKCGLCSMRSSVRSEFDEHFATKHPDEPVSVFALYYKVEEADAEAAAKVEQCQPIWQRNNPRRIRHVRGILIEEVKVARGSPMKRKLSTGQKSPVKRPALPSPPAGALASRNGSKGAAGQARRRAIKRALRHTTSGRMRQPAALEVPDPKPDQEHTSEPDQTSEPEPESPRREEPTEADGAAPARATDDEFLSLFESKSCELGPKGDADVDAKQFVCPRCKKYRTRRKRDFTMHLYKELGYNRFVCGNCGHMNTSMANMKRHHEMMHKVARLPEAIVPLTPDSAQEEWIEAVLDHQERQIDGRPPADEEPKQEKQEAGPEPKPEEAAPPTAEPEPVPQTAAEEEPKSEAEASPRRVVPPPAAAAESPSAPIYKCGFCDERGTIPQLRGHWKAQHSNQRFKIIKQMQRYACNHCSFMTAKLPLLRAHLTNVHPGAPITDFTTRAHDRQVRYKCRWCKETRFATRAIGEAHHAEKHPQLELKVESYTARKAEPSVASAPLSSHPIEPPSGDSDAGDLRSESASVVDAPAAAAGPSSTPPAAPPGSFRCPLCSYTGSRVTYVDAHLLSHYKRYKCETCGYVDGMRTVVSRHHARKHPGEPERVVLLDHLEREYQQMKRSVRDQSGPAAARAASPARSDITTGSRGSRGTKRSTDGVSPASKRPPGPASATRSTGQSPRGVARKSTAGARLSYARVGRGVALKSTGGARRIAAPYSFYGTKPPPVSSFSEVTTQLTLGGATSMRVNVPTLAQIVRLYPRCCVVDLRQKPLAL
ncbi:RE1-silencing transcription factor [Amphibalanus amphitrite]|uniref:RE1-silencing transcription factor n=1 Tax=Amphibalanus amphitrite TaxID=1232801 RepID=A0A6A4W9X6_AMPAM|nr:RE1-silencing transcription factor [Amphibalanus amphitrite]